MDDLAKKIVASNSAKNYRDIIRPLSSFKKQELSKDVYTKLIDKHGESDKFRWLGVAGEINTMGGRKSRRKSRRSKRSKSKRRS